MSEQSMMETNFIAARHFSSSYDILNHMRGNNKLCDIKIVIGDKKISAHKNVLASYSDYFYKMFTEDFKDNILDLNDNKELTPVSFELLIDFMYTSQLIIDAYNVKELLVASNFLLLGDVKEECLKCIEDIINIDNFMTFKDTDILNALFLSFVLNNYNNVVESSSFLSFSFELIMELIQSDDLCADEEKVYESTMLWLKHDLEERSKYLPELIKSIRLGLISIDYLNNTVQEEELIKSNVKCMNYLCEAYKMQSHITTGKEDLALNCSHKHRKFTQKLQISNISENENLKDNNARNVLYINNSEEIKSFKFEQIMKLIKSDDLYSDETQVYEATILWVNQDIENRSELLPELLQAVRLPSIPIKYLVEVIETEKLIISNPKCMNLLYNAYKIHALKSAGLSILASSICNYKYRNSGQVLIIKYGSSTTATLEWFNVIDDALYPSTLKWTELMSSIILSDGRIFSLKMIGLFSGSKCYASIYNGDVKKWEDTIVSNFYHGRLFTQCNYSSMIQFYDRVYVMSYAGVEYYDIIKRSWHVVNFRISKDTKEVSLAVVSELIYVITDTRSFYYDPKTDVGQLIHPMSTPLVGYSTCSLNNQLYVIGGEIRNDKTSSFRCIPSALVSKYDSQYHTWVRIASMNVPRYNAGAVAINGKIYVIGGRENNTIEYYNPQTEKWILSEKKLTSPKHKTSAFVLGVQANIYPKNILNYYSQNTN